MIPGEPVFWVVAIVFDGGSQPGDDTAGRAVAPLTPGGEEAVLRAPGRHLRPLLPPLTQWAQTLRLLQLKFLWTRISRTWTNKSR